jgi:hypothetical protein
MKTLRIGLMVLTLGSSAFAVDSVIPLGDMSVLENGAGKARIVFHPAPLDLPENIAIGRAQLSFAIPLVGETRTVRVRVHPVTSAWTAGLVTWTLGWSQPGGDFDPDLAADAEVTLGVGGEASFDVTGILQEIEAGYFADGFILTVPQEDGVGLNVADVAAFTGVAAATFDVFYRSIPERQIE